MVEGSGFENRRTASYQGFESLLLRHFFLLPTSRRWRSIPLRAPSSSPPGRAACGEAIQGSPARIRISAGAKVKVRASIWASMGFALAAGSCAKTKPPEAVTSNQAPTVAQVVTSFVVQKCPDAPKMNSRKAETALRQMLSPCDGVPGGGVPGGSVHFAATLMPGGRIELASAVGEPREGVVPICVLKHTLTHPVSLERPCTFDVRLEASRRAPPSGVAGPSAND